MPLSWRDLGKSDVPSLHKFSCIYPRKVDQYRSRPPRHSRPFQVIVQSYLRNLKPPLYPPKHVFGGFNETGELCVVVCYQSAQSKDRQPAHFVGAFARESSCVSGGEADAGMDELLRRLREHNEVLGSDPGVLCKVHNDNRAAKKFFTRHGFVKLGADGDKHHYWGRVDCSPTNYAH